MIRRLRDYFIRNHHTHIIVLECDTCPKRMLTSHSYAYDMVDLQDGLFICADCYDKTVETLEKRERTKRWKDRPLYEVMSELKDMESKINKSGLQNKK